MKDAEDEEFERIEKESGWRKRQVASGFTMRDYFAAKAMQGLLGSHARGEDIPGIAYDYADLMLRVRQ